MNKTLTTKIAGISVELELYEEQGEQRSNCFLSYTHGRKSWSASLEAARYNCALDPNHDDYESLEISVNTFDKIEDWAVQNGY